MDRWRITIDVWPHSTGNGAVADQAAAGDRTRYFYVSARDIEEAMRFAHCYAEGIMANPMVWRAPIFGVHRVKSLDDSQPAVAEASAS